MQHKTIRVEPVWFQDPGIGATEEIARDKGLLWARIDVDGPVLDVDLTAAVPVGRAEREAILPECNFVKP